MNTALTLVRLSDHFTLQEATESQEASRYNLDNIPPPEIIPTLEATALCMERVRALLGSPIPVSSWYRSLKLNRVLRSKDSSQHRKGEAVDFSCPGFGTPLEICRKLIEYKDLIRYDQLILEHTWVHISFDISGKNPRGQVLSLLENGSYSVGLTNKKGVRYE